MGRLQEWKDRKVVQWVVGYCAGAWALLQVLDFLTARFGWPVDVVKVLAILLAVGVPAVAILAWFHGERGAQRVSAMETISLATLALVGALGAWTVLRPAAADTNSTTSRAREDDALAIVPFRNLSGDSTQEFFSAGFTEELSTALGSVEGLRIIAPDAFVFKGGEQDVRQLALDLAAKHVLQGSVRRAGNTVRVTARLISARDGRQVWSRSYDEQLSRANLVAIQEQIARLIVGTLRLHLLSNNALPSRGTNSQDAWDAYMRGVGALATVDPLDNEIAAREFRKAIALDSMFARAYSGLAFANVGYFWPARGDPDGLQKVTLAERVARRAIALDSTLAEPHVVLSRIAEIRGDTAASTQQLAIALRKEPGARWPRFFMAMHWLMRRQRASALAAIDTLLEYEPASAWNHIMAAHMRNIAGDYQGAAAALNRAEELAKSGFGPYPEWALYWNRGYEALVKRDYIRAGNYYSHGHVQDQAGYGVAEKRVLHSLAALQRTEPDSLRRRAAALALMQTDADKMQPFLGALVYLHLGAKDKAADLLGKTWPQSWMWYNMLAEFDPVRNDPAFKNLVIPL